MSKASRPELLVFACADEDLEVLRGASALLGSDVRLAASPMAVARRTTVNPPVAVVLGIGTRTMAHLDIIPVVRAWKKDLPVIVVAEEDSLELERYARQREIFYYLVHPLDRSEVEAVLKDVLRQAGT